MEIGSNDEEFFDNQLDAIIVQTDAIHCKHLFGRAKRTDRFEQLAGRQRDGR
jgi:hypothetical protein